MQLHVYIILSIDLGLQQHRLDGDEYISVIDEFMEAVFTRWPHVIVQVYILHIYVHLVNIMLS